MNRQEELSSALSATRALIPAHVTLIVVTKTFPVSDVEILYQLGERNFGENRDSEGASKAEALPNDVIWHFQGGIQSNKLRSIVTWSDYIHSLDDLRHAEKISTIAQELGKRQKCFIQINLDVVPTTSGRSGISPTELLDFASATSEMPGLEIVGLMGVGPINQDPRPAFEELQRQSQILQERIAGARFISAGMSGDFQIAIECGATHVRLGSSILGSR